MIARIHKHMKENDKGFTLIELLVVVIIIGILAAIAIPAFLSQREKAWKKQVTSDMKNAITAAEAYATDNNGFYTDLDEAALEANGYRATDGVTITVVSASENEFVLNGEHASVPGTWVYDSNDTGVIVEP